MSKVNLRPTAAIIKSSNKKQRLIISAQRKFLVGKF